MVVFGLLLTLLALCSRVANTVIRDKPDDRDRAASVVFVFIWLFCIWSVAKATARAVALGW